SEMGTLTNKLPINKNQLGRRSLYGPPCQILLLELNLSLFLQQERRACDCRNVGKTPVLIMGRRKTYFAETRKGIVAKPSQPGKIASCCPLLKLCEVLEIVLYVLNCRGHVLDHAETGVCRASVSVQLYPF